MQKELVCSKAAGVAGVDLDAFDVNKFVDQEIAGGCPVESRIESPVTIRKLIVAGFFHPVNKRCDICCNFLGLNKCMKKYSELSLENKMRVGGMIEDAKIRIVDCPGQIPATS